MATTKKNVNTSAKTGTKTSGKNSAKTSPNGKAGARTSASAKTGAKTSANAKAGAKSTQGKKTETAADRTTTKVANGQQVAPVKKRRRRGITKSQLFTFLSVVVGLILCMIVTMIMRNNYLKVEVVRSEYPLGEAFSVTAFVQAVNENATVELDGEFAPEEIGTAKIHYIVTCGKLKKKGSVTVEVVDNNYPEIVGPSTLGAFIGEELNLLDYYTVEDEQPDLTSELMISAEPDFSCSNVTDYTLGVTDWGNNYSTKDITIRVCAYDGEARATAIAIREFNRYYGVPVSNKNVRTYCEDEENDVYYVLIQTTYMIKVEGLEYTIIGEMDEDDELFTKVAIYGDILETSSYSTFNYNAS